MDWRCFEILQLVVASALKIVLASSYPETHLKRSAGL